MTIRVAELFAGVGGFRIGLEGEPGSSRDSKFKVVFANQWEPSTKKQHAAEVYTARWNLTQHQGEPAQFSNGDDDVFILDDISKIPEKEIPQHDLLVGGFPCQDYSVAKTLDKATGLRGKKGVLWWEIDRILRHHRPKYVMLENVDRLIKSPVKQRGRDFAVMLSCLDELGYAVEWRVINAADYGMPQRRRRVFICAYSSKSLTYEKMNNAKPEDWLKNEGLMANAFPIESFKGRIQSNVLKQSSGDDLAKLSDEFNINGLPGNKSPFMNTGMMLNNQYHTAAVVPQKPTTTITLGDVLIQNEDEIKDEFYLTPSSLLADKGWIYLKGSKKEERKGTDGFTYFYNEGPVNFPDPLDKPSRTIITGEGGSGTSRFKHVVRCKISPSINTKLDLSSKLASEVRQKLNLENDEWVRRLIPEELELLNMFPKGHTSGQSDGKRAFFMGNALVVGVVKKLGDTLFEFEQ